MEDVPLVTGAFEEVKISGPAELAGEGAPQAEACGVGLALDHAPERWKGVVVWKGDTSNR